VDTVCAAGLPAVPVDALAPLFGAGALAVVVGEEQPATLKTAPSAQIEAATRRRRFGALELNKN